jgi:mannose-6-phosphate isomerase-like protein (cupin superfamily)
LRALCNALPRGRTQPAFGFRSQSVKPKNIEDFEEWFQVMHTTGRSQVATMELAAGKSTGDEAEAHDHSDQVLLVTRGSIKGEIDKQEVSLKQGQFVVIPANTKHRFYNDTGESALTFNVYAPPAYPPDEKG